MCDDVTERENDELLSRRGLALGAAALCLPSRALALSLTAACGRPPAAAPASVVPAPAPSSTSLPTRRRDVVVETPDGQADAVFVAPDVAEAHPGVVLWPDVAGLRDAYTAMAARLAGAGYAVLAVNPYYRSAKSPVLASFDEWRTKAGRARIEPMRAALTAEGVARDGVAFVAWLDRQPEVDPARKIGAQGYCMSGSFAFRVAAAAPERVGAVASFHGGGLYTSEPDSPHTLLSAMRAAILVCVAQSDHDREPEATAGLEQAAAAAGVTAEIEVYPANHGWCTTDAPVYDAVQAERAWARLLATYAAHL